MKNFMEPELNVLKFAIEDVIASSAGGEGGGDDNMLEPDWD